EIGQLPSMQTGVAALGYSPDGRMLAVAVVRGNVTLWEVKTRTLVRQLQGAPFDTMALRFSTDGRLLTWISQDQMLRTWDVATGKQIRHSVLDHPDGISATAFSADDSKLATSGPGNAIHIWGQESGQHMHRLNVGSPAHYGSALAFSGDCRTLAAVCNYN